MLGGCTQWLVLHRCEDLLEMEQVVRRLSSVYLGWGSSERVFCSFQRGLYSRSKNMLQFATQPMTV